MHRNRTSRLRIIVLGYIVRGPLGGLAWHHLQYVMGLTALGHDVHFVEDSDDYPSCYNPTKNITDTDPAYGLQFATNTFEKIGLNKRWAYYDAHTSRWLGPGADQVMGFCADADLLLNLSGVNPLRPWLQKIPVKVLVDTDPVFTQVRHLTDAASRTLALQHNAFFSFAENIDNHCSTIPDDGLPWQATRQPIVLSAWPVTPGPRQAKFTTVMQWDSYAACEYNGSRYGTKSSSFGPFLNLPERAGQKFELAIGSSTAPRALLCRRGWAVCDPRDPTRDPWTYQRYIQQSKGEFSVAKHAYVITSSGWFSERSAAYLASGRPVVTQETGFSKFLPADQGLFSFHTLEDVMAALDAIEGDYESNCRAARQIAEEFFDARKIIRSVLERALS